MNKDMMIFRPKYKNRKEYFKDMINHIKSHYVIPKESPIEELIISFEDLLTYQDDLEKAFNEYYMQNLNLRADIMIKKMSIPDERIKDSTFYILYNMPTYEELQQENQKLRQQLYELGGVDEYNRHLINKQQQFIKYLEDEIKRLNENDIYEPLQCMALETLKHILRRYKEIMEIPHEENK